MAISRIPRFKRNPYFIYRWAKPKGKAFTASQDLAEAMIKAARGKTPYAVTPASVARDFTLEPEDAKLVIREARSIVHATTEFFVYMAGYVGKGAPGNHTTFVTDDSELILDTVQWYAKNFNTRSRHLRDALSSGLYWMLNSGDVDGLTNAKAENIFKKAQAVYDAADELTEAILELEVKS